MDQSGMQSYAIQFSDNGYLAINSADDFNFSTNDFSLEAWIKTFSGGTVIGHKGTDGGHGNGGFLLVVNPDGSIKFATDNGFGFFEVVSRITSVADGIWHHVAAVRQGVNLSLYLDGDPLSCTSRGNFQPPLDVNNSLRLTLGTVDQTQEPNRFFSGQLAEIRIWNMARTSDDIKLHNSEKLGADIPGLVGYWAADFGLSIDFSARRQATTNFGITIMTPDGPPVLGTSEISCLFLFSGQYLFETNSGDGSAQWENSGLFYVTPGGIVVLNNTRINGACFDGNTLFWPATGNPGSATVTFKLESDSDIFWPEGPQQVPLFEGKIQPNGLDSMIFRGLIQPTKLLCGDLISYANGLVILSGNGAPGTPLVLSDKTPGKYENFCIDGNGVLLVLKTGNAVGIDGIIQAGSRLIIKSPTSEGSDIQWAFEADGTIRPKSNNNLAVSFDANSPHNLILAAANSSDPLQKWLSIFQGQFIWNNISDYVLTAKAEATPYIYNTVTGQQKTVGTPGQLWYLRYNAIFSNVNDYALTVNGPAKVGVPLRLARYHAMDSQNFTSNGMQIVHEPSGLILKLDQTGAIVLADSNEISDSTSWVIAPIKDQWTPQRANLASALAKRSLTASADGMVDYIITIITNSTIAAGTDDRVEIALVGEKVTSQIVKLSQSETHSNPFESGQTDVFTVRLKDVGILKGIFFRYGDNAWFYIDRWVVSSVTVFDSSRLIYYGTGELGDGMQFEMPYKTTLYFEYHYYDTNDSIMNICKAPSQDTTTRGWVDHTWAVVKSSNSTTYFDCAGGHDAPGTVNNIISVKCLLNNAIKMATAHDIGPQYPYKTIYGTNDVNGIETCGVRASGFRNWDGQCHQMVNRLLYICNPVLTLADAGVNKLAGYGLSCILWGPYGVGFSDWCRQIGINPPASASNGIFDYIQRFIGNRQQSEKVLYYATSMQSEIAKDPQGPQGDSVKKFICNVHNEGISNATIANLVCLPEDEVEHEEL